MTPLAVTPAPACETLAEADFRDEEWVGTADNDNDSPPPSPPARLPVRVWLVEILTIAALFGVVAAWDALRGRR